MEPQIRLAPEEADMLDMNNSTRMKLRLAAGRRERSEIRESADSTRATSSGRPLHVGISRTKLARRAAAAGVHPTRSLPSGPAPDWRVSAVALAASVVVLPVALVGYLVLSGAAWGWEFFTNRGQS